MVDGLAGRVAVVTGGAEGIGRGIALTLAAEGVRVAIADIDLRTAELAVGELRDAGVEALAVRVDVSDPAAMRAFAERVERDLGPVSVLCNNAGVMLDGTLVESTPEDWQWVLSVNLMGIVHGVSAFVPRMRERGEPAHIVNTCSMAGLAPRLAGGLGIYSASKAAAVAYSEMLRAELAPSGIGVTTLCPSTVNTRIWSASRNRPTEFGEGRPVPVPERISAALEPEQIGPLVVRAILEDRAYLYTGADMRSRIEERTARVLADIEHE
ncbi:MAG: SDR family NAD(P)-dependent oxidoreductase [Dehalococcoidia bacterium]|nr:SDR family NAD(P)-dependent oxidoreductase [Dehalococcoidia bacterium]